VNSIEGIKYKLAFGMPTFFGKRVFDLKNYGTKADGKHNDPPAGLLSPTGSLILAQGKTAQAVAALGWVLKNTSQAESLHHRSAGKLAMIDVRF
jgi:hypothetical protein